MAKKKKKPTPKDDLIESLMNDVQEISDQPTHFDKDVEGGAFSDEEGSKTRSNENFLLNVGGEENRVDEPSASFVSLWQHLKEPSAPKAKLEIDQAPNNQSEPEEFENSSELPPVASLHAEISGNSEADDKTFNIQAFQEAESDSEPSINLEPQHHDDDRTIAVDGFANRQPNAQKNISAKVSLGTLRDPRPTPAGGSVYASSEANLAQAENLKLAQRRILELEKEVEKYRQENEELDSAGEIIRNRYEELTSRFFTLEKEKQEVSETLQNELLIIKGTLQHKETEVSMARLKIEELESRLKSDFKKIRVRERELENRLELVKAEKTALLRAKDENILELKRKIDHVQSELDNYRSKVAELNKAIGFNQEQFKRTVRALRLALSNLEVKEENLVPLKKAE
ncbi:MAG: hypothetical protein ACXWRA_05740 [Pseudobdellovibrionaceae bacterium]